MLSDFRFALRTLAKAPGFTVVAVLTLALAIGVNSAIFSIVNGLILRPTIPKKPQEVVAVFNARHGAAHDYRITTSFRTSPRSSSRSPASAPTRPCTAASHSSFRKTFSP